MCVCVSMFLCGCVSPFLSLAIHLPSTNPTLSIKHKHNHHSLTHALSSTVTAAALEHGTTDDDSSTTLKPAPKTHTAWAHHATSSLGAYIARRLAFTCRASLYYTPLEKAGEAARLLLESFFHLGFVLAVMLIIGTPVSLYYTPGNYCNFYWSDQCTNGQNIGNSLPRFVATCVAAVYTGACMAVSKPWPWQLLPLSMLDEWNERPYLPPSTTYIHICHLRP